MDRIEQAALMECLREVRTRIGYGTAKELAAKLFKQIDAQQTEGARGVTEDAVLEYVQGRQVNKDTRLETAKAALSVLAENHAKVMGYYGPRNPHTRSFLYHILSKYKDIQLPLEELVESAAPETVPSSSPSNAYVDNIFAKWRASIRRGNGILQTGVYQIYRRYKPPIEGASKAGAYDWSNPRNHPVICELIYVDSNAMECVLITAERNVYFGTMHINHEDILFGLVQRITRGKGINHRFISLRMEGRKLPMYSGLCVKVGDTTRRPIAAECFYVRVPPVGRHSELHEAFQQIRQNPWRGGFVVPIEEGSVVARYLTDIPPYGPYDPENPAWNRVKFIRDFEKLEDILAHDERLFREPLRTIKSDTIIEVANHTVLSVFRQDS